MDIFLFFVGAWFGLLILPLWLIGFTILFIKQLSDDPAKPEKPYFFTAIEPGRIKAVLRGGEVRRYLMNYAGSKFSRTGEDMTKDEHWDVVNGDDTVPLMTPEPFTLLGLIFWPFFPKHNFLWFIWVVWKVTGHTFVGIYPFQTLHLYMFTRKVQKLDANGKPITDEQGLPKLEDSSEMTDHVRARAFVWPVEGQAGETKEALKVQVRGIANVRTNNPQKALFGADRWDILLTSTILRVLASEIRTMPIDQVLTAGEGGKENLATAVKEEANKRLNEDFGLEIIDYQILDFESQLSPEDASALTAKWRAEQQKVAERITGEGRGDGRSAEITRVSNAIKEGGEEAKRAQEFEALIRQAAEAGKSGGVVILGGQNGSTDSGVNSAILAELKKLNQK